MPNPFPVMTVSIMEIGHLTNGTSLPANNFEEPFGLVDDRINLPLAALWDHARSGITKLVHFSFKNLHEILGHAEISISNSASSEVQHYERSSLSLNSQVISGSLGRARHIQLPEPVQITLKHLNPIPDVSTTQPVCVFWDFELSAWSDLGCSTVATNASHTICECEHLTNFALAMAPEALPTSSPAFSIMTLQIVTYVVAAVSAACVVLILVKVGQVIRLNLQSIN